MRTLILARHAHASSNAADIVNCTPPGEGLSLLGIEQAKALGEALAGERIDLGVATEFLRTQETLARALDGRDTPTIVLPDLNEIHFGRYEGGSLGGYREWAWTAAPDAPCPGGGESRAAAARRFAGALEILLEREEDTIFAVAHGLPVHYVLVAAAGRRPSARIGTVCHASPNRLDRDAVEASARGLRAWSTSPRFADTSEGV